MTDRIHCTQERGCAKHPAMSEKDLGFSCHYPMDLSFMLSDRKERAEAYQRHLSRVAEEEARWTAPQERPDPMCIIAGEIASHVRSCGTCFYAQAGMAGFLRDGVVPPPQQRCRRFPTAEIKEVDDYCGEWKARP